MKKTTKGALAAAAAGTLLVGGAGTYAFWTDSATVDGGRADVGPAQAHGARAATPTGRSTASEGPAALYAGRDLVSRRHLTKECTYTIDAEGDHLEGELNVANGPTFDSTALSDALDASASTFVIDGGTFSNEGITPGVAVRHSRTAPTR